MSNTPLNIEQNQSQIVTKDDQDLAAGVDEALKPAVQTPEMINSEIRPTKPRRSFKAKYKLKILDELDRCTAAGDKGAILRREGLYSSHIAEWRSQRDEGTLGALSKVRGRKKTHDKKDVKILSLEKQVDTLKIKLSQAEAIIDVQKKISEIFGISHQGNLDNEKNS